MDFSSNREIFEMFELRSKMTFKVVSTKKRSGSVFGAFRKESRDFCWQRMGEDDVRCVNKGVNFWHSSLEVGQGWKNQPCAV